MQIARDKKRKKDADRRRKWYQSISDVKKEEIRARMRAYYQANKERMDVNAAKRREKIRLGKTADQPDPA